MATPTVASLADYQYLGCYTDTPRRLLDAAAVGSVNMTAQFCADYCNGAISPARFYPFVGVEDGAQCFCGGATIGVAVLAALFGLAALGAAMLWFFARRRRMRRLSAQSVGGQDVSKAWSPVQVQPQYQAQYQPPVELGNQIRSPVELSTGQPERRA